MEDFNRHNKEINENLTYWQNKPILQTIYNDFYALIGAQVDRSQEGLIVELGSGIGNLKQHIPECICTDVFPNPWIDQVENAYRMSFADESVSNLILFDVFHHLEYPKAALNEFRRVLKPHGRVIPLRTLYQRIGMDRLRRFSQGACSMVRQDQLRRWPHIGRSPRLLCRPRQRLPHLPTQPKVSRLDR